MRLPAATELGKLRIRDVYEYYDGPRIFSCENTAERLFLALSAEDLPEGGTWLYCPLSSRRLAALLDRAIDLHTVFTQPEDGYLYEVNVSHTEAGDEASPVMAERVADRHLPLNDEYLNFDPADLNPVEGPVAPIHALQTRRETLRLALSPRGILGSEAPSRLVGQVLVGIQELVSAIGQAVEGVATTRGRIGPDILEATELRAVGAFAGSFGVELSAARLSNLFNESLLADSLDALDKLIGAGSDEHQLREILEHLKPRAASKYQSLVALLADSATGVTFDWGSVDESRGSFRQIGADALGGIAAALKLVDTADTTEYSVTGVLIGLNTRTRLFEIEDRIERRRVGGKLDPERFAQDEEFTINGVYRATIRETVEVSGVTGDESVHRVLVELDEAR